MQADELIDQRFQLDREVAAGGMGRIWRALDRQTGRPVAIKAMTVNDPAALDRFRREAVLLAELRHPGIVEYIAHGTCEGRPYLAMEWLDGADLAHRLRGTRIDHNATARVRPADAGSAPMRTGVGLDVADVLALARRLASALATVHARGVVHRDLKPGNIYLVDGDLHRAKLIDFGTAREAAGAALTAAGIVVGTPYYMAPEQVRGDVVGAAADIWGLGAVLYECLAGRPAFTASHPLAAMARIMVDEPTPLAQLRPEASRELLALVHGMLAKDAAARPRSGDELVTTLERIEATRTGGWAPAPDTGEVEAHARWRLTGSEARVRSLLFARRADPADPAALVRLRAIVTTHGGALEPVAAVAGALLVTGDLLGSPRDQASAAAHLALALHGIEPDLALAVVTGRGTDGEHHTPVGEVVDHAVELLLATGTGEIRVDKLTAGLLEGRYDVRGSDAAASWLLLGARQAVEARTLLGRPSRWVGRRRELTTLLATFDACVEDAVARAVVVTGGPGMGKSRLRHETARALRERDEAPLILHGQADALAAGSPFVMIAPALRRHFGLDALGADAAAPTRAAAAARLRVQLGELMPAGEVAVVAPFLGELLGVAFDDADDQALRAARGDPMLLGERMRGAVEAWLRAECARRPVLWVLEDLHWGDLPSVSCLDGVLRALHDRPLMLLATARPEVHDVFPRLWTGRDVQEIALHALPPRACAELASDALGDRATDDVVEAIVARCEGNAFYLEELVRAVAEGAGGADGVLPETVLGMVQARLDGLDQEERRLLRAAAIFGEVFWEDGVRALLGSGGSFDVVEWLDDLVRRELIQPERDGRLPGQKAYRFRHALLRDGAYQMLTDDDRRAGHVLAGGWLERAGEHDALTLAGHFERGGDGAAAVHWYRRAVEDALEGNDLLAVLERGERAIAAGASGEVLGELRGLQSIAAYWRSDYAAALRHGEASLARLPAGSAGWFRAAGAASVAAARLGDYVAVDRLFDRALAATPTASRGAEAARLVCLCRGTFQLIFAGRLARADEILTRIAALHAAAADVDAFTTAQVEHVQGVRAAHVGDVATFLRHLSAAVDAFERAGDIRNVSLERTTVAWCWAELGDFAQAEALCRASLARGLALRAPQAVTYARVNLGFILAASGRRELGAEARAVLSEAIAECSSVGNLRLEGWARAHRSAAHLAAGDAGAAEADADRAAELLAVSPGLQAWARGARARARVALGRTVEALADARAAMATLVELGGLLQGESVPPLALVEALRARGDDAGADDALVAARARLAQRASRLPAAGRARFLAIPENAQLLAMRSSSG